MHPLTRKRKETSSLVVQDIIILCKNPVTAQATTTKRSMMSVSQQFRWFTTYNKALQLKPNEVAVHNNIGMSYILEGDLKQAEASLRQAQKLPDGEFNQTLRQNLALSVGLQGRFDEAREIASRDLPPAQVEENLAFLKKMLNQDNTWQKLKQPS